MFPSFSLWRTALFAVASGKESTGSGLLFFDLSVVSKQHYLSFIFLNCARLKRAIFSSTFQRNGRLFKRHWLCVRREKKETFRPLLQTSVGGTLLKMYRTFFEPVGWSHPLLVLLCPRFSSQVPSIVDREKANQSLF